MLLGTADGMYWDTTGKLLVDPTSKCGYDAWHSQSLTTCASVCVSPSCIYCDVACNYAQYSYKLGPIYYALRVMGIEGDPSIATAVSQMQARFGESQGSDGGVAFEMAINIAGTMVYKVPATVGGTAIAVLANTVQHAP